MQGDGNWFVCITNIKLSCSGEIFSNVLLLYPLMKYVRCVFYTTVEIYDKVATNKTPCNKICVNEWYDYIEGRIFIGYLALLKHHLEELF
jgi:hypothetical protein